MGQEARYLAKYIMSKFKNKEILDSTEVRQRSEWEFLVPQDRDWETDTKRSCERDHKKRADIFEHWNCDWKTREICRAFDGIKLERMQEVTFVVGDP